MSPPVIHIRIIPGFLACGHPLQLLGAYESDKSGYDQRLVSISNADNKRRDHQKVIFLYILLLEVMWYKGKNAGF